MITNQLFFFRKCHRTQLLTFINNNSAQMIILIKRINITNCAFIDRKLPEILLTDSRVNKLTLN